jgi:2-hydroxychromene-2-carboxylate isomerase
MAARVVTVYIDYKSPYAYLAKDPAWELEREFDVRLDWLPYTLDIPDFLGTVEGRNPHQWRRVRYSYMDARRLANRRGLTVRGPQKLFDSSIAAVGMLYAERHEVFRKYNDLVFRALLEARAGYRRPRSDSRGAFGGWRTGRELL